MIRPLTDALARQIYGAREMAEGRATHTLHTNYDVCAIMALSHRMATRLALGAV